MILTPFTPTIYVAYPFSTLLDENPTLLEHDFNKILKKSAERERLTEIILNIFYLSADFFEKPFKWPEKP
ncbi:hypothetical protein CHI08_12035 [Peribacillus simplex]|nr:hypothetical protein CHI08_12035 [Peribacillus simplex]